MKTKVYGASDDLVLLEKDDGSCEEIGCYDSIVTIFFRDGTKIRVGYPKKEGAIWWIEVLEDGEALFEFRGCTDEEAEIYSDIFIIESEMERYSVQKISRR